MLRVAICMHVREGTAGVLSAYVVPKNAPKTCSRIQCFIKTLSQHRRIREPNNSLPFSQLDISGDFRASDAHQWLLNSLPELPKPSPALDVRLAFESTSLKTQVAVMYGDGNIRLLSDNICAVAALRDSITRWVPLPRYTGWTIVPPRH
jgi:hypothetical protein